MTETEWLTSTDVQAMLAFLTAGVRGVTYDNPTIEAGVPLITPRKLRLFACACARQAWDGVVCPTCKGKGMREVTTRPPLPHDPVPNLVGCTTCGCTGRTGGLTDPRSRHAVEVAERYADGEATHDELTAAYYDGARPNENVSLAVRWCSTGHTGYTAYEKARNTAQELRGAGQSPAVQSALLRCLCGNPWQPVTLQTYEATPSRVESGVLGAHRVCPTTAGRFVDPPWLCRGDGTVPQMARQIYADRDWALLPQLADALEEAGCPAEVACPTCEGSLHRIVEVASQKLQQCTTCWGDRIGWPTGRVGHPLLDHLRGRDTRSCPRCRGEGKLPHPNGIMQFVVCTTCRGTGRAPAVHARGCHVLDLLLGLS